MAVRYKLHCCLTSSIMLNILSYTYRSSIGVINTFLLPWICIRITHYQCCCSTVFEQHMTSDAVPLYLNNTLSVLLFLCIRITHYQCWCSSVFKQQTTSAAVPLYYNNPLPVLLFLCIWTTHDQCCFSSVIE